MKLLPVEEKFIAMLTKIVWWFDVKWNKGTLFVYFFFSFAIPAFFGFFFILTEPQGDASVFIVKLLTLPILFSLCFGFIPLIAVAFIWIDSRVNVFKQIKYSPNPNRYNGFVWKIRLILFSLSLSNYFLFKEHYEEGNLPLILIIIISMISTILASCYTLCVDPLPPAEKKRMQERDKLKKLQLQTSPSTG